MFWIIFFVVLVIIGAYIAHIVEESHTEDLFETPCRETYHDMHPAMTAPITVISEESQKIAKVLPILPVQPRPADKKPRKPRIKKQPSRSIKKQAVKPKAKQSDIKFDGESKPVIKRKSVGVPVKKRISVKVAQKKPKQAVKRDK